MKISGPDFIALQVPDLDQAATFYTETMGLTRAPQSPPGAVVFATKPIPFAVREPLDGVDLDAAAPHPGVGIALWLLCDDTQAAHDQLADEGVEIVAPPAQSPFGTTCTIRDNSGYLITLHDKS